jgi:Tfp pilus assembly protein PilF
MHLAMSLSMNPKWRKEAEENLLKAIELDPSNAEPYAQLGKLYQKAGLLKRAESRFQEALRWDRNNQTARKGLQELEARGKGGIGDSLRSLFKDKKTK